jgi:tetratricopeptide (TPR) repeat protein
MLRYGTGLIFLWSVALLPGRFAASAETWHLEDGQGWERVSDEAREAYDKAKTYLGKGKRIKAARSFDTFLKECEPTSELYAAALDEQFVIAKEYLGGRKRRVLLFFRIKGYATGVKMMERISARANSGGDKVGAAVEGAESAEEKERLRKLEGHLKELAANATVEVARSYEERAKRDIDNYELAYFKWLEAFETYDRSLRVSSSGPTGEIGKDSLLGMGRCMELSYRGPAYDATVLRGRPFTELGIYSGAEGCYEEFKAKYPQDAPRFDMDEKLEHIAEELARKDLYTGIYYGKAGNRQAANLYYQMVLREWPGTEAAGTAQKLLLSNIAQKDVEN